MGLLSIFRRPATAIEGPAPRAAVQSSSGGVMINSAADLDRYLRDGDTNSAAGVRVDAESAMRAAAVYACVRIIAGKVATLPVDVKRKADERTRLDASDHPVAKIFSRRPNRFMKPAQFKRLATTQILLRGNAYALIVRGRRGGVTDLIPLDPDHVTVKLKKDHSVEYVYRRKDGGTENLRQSEVFHLMGMTLNGYEGVSVLKYAAETIGLSLATTRHGSVFFRNGTNIGDVIQHPARLGSEGLAFLKESLDKYRQGGRDEAKTLILEEGATFEKIGMSMEDAAFVDTLKLSRTDIAMFFGVPPHMLGDTEKSTSWGTGIEQQALGFVAYTLEDWLTAWEEAINVDLIGDGEPDVYARFNRNALIRGDIKARSEAYAKGLQWGWLSPNEVRVLEDMNPRDGGDDYYLPPNTAGDANQSKGGGDEPS